MFGLRGCFATIITLLALSRYVVYTLRVDLVTDGCDPIPIFADPEESPPGDPQTQREAVICEPREEQPTFMTGSVRLLLAASFHPFVDDWSGSNVACESIASYWNYEHLLKLPTPNNLGVYSGLPVTGAYQTVAAKWCHACDGEGGSCSISLSPPCQDPATLTMPLAGHGMKRCDIANMNDLQADWPKQGRKAITEISATSYTGPVTSYSGPRRYLGATSTCLSAATTSSPTHSYDGYTLKWVQSSYAALDPGRSCFNCDDVPSPLSFVNSCPDPPQILMDGVLRYSGVSGTVGGSVYLTATGALVHEEDLSDFLTCPLLGGEGICEKDVSFKINVQPNFAHITALPDALEVYPLPSESALPAGALPASIAELMNCFVEGATTAGIVVRCASDPILMVSNNPGQETAYLGQTFASTSTPLVSLSLRYDYDSLALSGQMVLAGTRTFPLTLDDQGYVDRCRDDGPYCFGINPVYCSVTSLYQVFCSSASPNLCSFAIEGYSFTDPIDGVDNPPVYDMGVAQLMGGSPIVAPARRAVARVTDTYGTALASVVSLDLSNLEELSAFLKDKVAYDAGNFEDLATQSLRQAGSSRTIMLALDSIMSLSSSVAADTKFRRLGAMLIGAHAEIYRSKQAIVQLASFTGAANPYLSNTLHSVAGLKCNVTASHTSGVLLEAPSSIKPCGPSDGTQEVVYDPAGFFRYRRDGETCFHPISSPSWMWNGTAFLFAGPPSTFAKAANGLVASASATLDVITLRDAYVNERFSHYTAVINQHITFLGTILDQLNMIAAGRADQASPNSLANKIHRFEDDLKPGNLFTGLASSVGFWLIHILMFLLGPLLMLGVLYMFPSIITKILSRAKTPRSIEVDTSV